MENPINVKSEIGKLKTVLLHRPGKELEGLVPEYMTRMLFDDVPYLKVAQEEHDAFAQVLRDNGVEVLYLDKMVEESLYTEELKWQFVREMVKSSKQADRRLTENLINYLGNMPALEMIHKVMAGVRYDELNVLNLSDISDEQKELTDYLKDDYPFVMDPMPNLYFTRDPGAAIGNGLTINKMHWPARRRESLFMKYIISYHPRFRNANVPVWYNRDGAFSMEGGDELVLNSEVMAIGISERTEPIAIEKMAAKLFAGSDFKKVIAMQIPQSHAFMHLDTVFTMIDYDKFTIHPEILDHNGELNVYILEKADTKSGYVVRLEHDIKKVLEQALEIEEVQLIQCGAGDPIAAAREQWNDGSNTLAIAPGVVVTYDRNYVTNDALRKAGVKVIEVTGAELGRGRGGPRCMSMPLVREDI